MTISANFPNVQPSLLLDFANAKQLPPQVTFTRATTAAYYDGSTTAMAEQNLIAYSNQPSTSPWSASCTVTNNAAVAPDGTTTAAQLTVASGKSAYQSVPWQTGASGTVTLWVKAAPSGSAAYFKFATNNSASWNTGLQSTKVALTSSWQMITLTGVLQSGSSTMNLHVDGSDYTTGSIDSDCYGNVLIWGIQVNTYQTATALTTTTTTPITNYVPVLLTAGGGQPRFDHNPTTSESLGLLIEQQSTNLMLQSEAVGTSPWGGLATGVEANTIVSPDGTLDGDKVYEGTGNNYQNRFQSVAQTATTYAFSVYAKKGQTDRFVMFAGSPQALLWIDMTTWTVFASSNVVSSSITAVGNGWYRCTLVYLNTSASSFQTGINLVQVGTTNTVTYAGNGFNGMYLWGAQLEQGAFATSYIPTTSAAATRAPDLATMVGQNFLSWFNAGEGTVVYELETARPGANTFSFNFDVGNSSSSRDVLFSSAGLGSNLYVTSGNSNQVNINAGVTPVAGTFFKTALFYELNNFAVSVNGNAAVTDTSGILPYYLYRLVLGTAYDFASANYIDGHIKKFAYYPQAVTAAQLAALSS